MVGPAGDPRTAELHRTAYLADVPGAAIALGEPADGRAEVPLLEARGLVVRTVDPNDRRVRRIVRTPEGEELRRTALDEALATAPTVATLSAAEQRTLCELLGKIAEPVALPF